MPTRVPAHRRRLRRRLAPRSVRRCLALPLVCVVLACQPVEADLDPAEASPLDPLPDQIAELQERLGSAAARWQHRPRLAELVVEVDERQSAVRAAATYVAAGAEEVLSVTVDAQGLDQHRQALREYGVEPLSVEAVDEIPKLPPESLDPAALLEAAADARDECGATSSPARVIYATGAPATWEGSGWRTPPTWRGIVVSGDRAVAVNPTSGDSVPPGCMS